MLVLYRPAVVLGFAALGLGVALMLRLRRRRRSRPRRIATGRP